MAIPPGQKPSGGDVSGAGAPQGAGISRGEVTTQPGQYPSSLFGVALPSHTGAPGTGGASGGADPANQPGQLNEGISGEGPADTANTGAPGSQGATNNPGGSESVSYTRPGAFLTGTNVTDTVSDDISGIGDWTQAHDGSYGGGPQLPGIAGNMPVSTGAGAGQVRRGGRGGRQ